MQLPFPTEFLRGLSELERKKALDIWNELNETSAKNPKEYRERIASILNEAVETEKEPSKSYIHHAYTLEVCIAALKLRIYVHVLTSEGVKPISGTEIPLILSKERVTQKDNHQQRIYDIIIHPNTLKKEENDSVYSKELHALFLDAIDNEYNLKLSGSKKIVKTSNYVGVWLWKKDGSQKEDYEMTSLNELSPKSLMQQVRHHHSIKEESLEKDLKKLELNSDEKVLERERADSKLLIQEIDSETSSTEINCKAASTLENSNYDKIPINTDDNVHCKNLFHQVVGYVFNIKNKPTASFNLQFLDSDFDYEAQELENRHLLRLTPRENGKKDLSLYFRFYSHEAEMIATAENLLKTSDTKVWKVQNPVMPLGDIKVKFSKKSKHLLITMHSLDI